jgi:hypothetical protein
MAHHVAPIAPAAHRIEVVAPDAAHALAVWWHAHGHAGPAPAVVPGRTLVVAASQPREGWTAVLAVRFVGDHAVVDAVVGESRAVAVLAARLASHLGYRGTATVDAAGAPSCVATALRAAGIAVVDGCRAAA